MTIQTLSLEDSELELLCWESKIGRVSVDSEGGLVVDVRKFVVVVVGSGVLGVDMEIHGVELVEGGADILK